MGSTFHVDADRRKVAEFGAWFSRHPLYSGWRDETPDEQIARHRALYVGGQIDLAELEGRVEAILRAVEL